MDEKKKILVVDDNKFDRQLVIDVLERQGFEVYSAESGEECMDLLSQMRVDLVLLDIMLPHLQGDQVLHMIRKDYSSIDLPVLMMTAKTEPSDIVETLYIGANDYIVKPVDFEIAIMRMMTHLKISDLSKEMVRLHEAVLMDALITTYNHEINNPLAIALGSLKGVKDKQDEENNLERLERALWRIADIVKKISEVRKKRNVELSSYTDKVKSLKIQK